MLVRRGGGRTGAEGRSMVTIASLAFFLVDLEPSWPSS